MLFFAFDSMCMKRDSEGYKKFIEAVRTFCKYNYKMNLDDVGELKRLQKLSVNISLSTLQRIFLGSNKQQKRVNDSTLNILAQFIGYNSVDECICNIVKNNDDVSSIC